MKVNLTLVYDRRGTSSRTKPAMIELVVTANRVRKYISTGIKLLPKEWDGRSVINCDDWKEKNERIAILRKKCSDIINRMIDEGNFDLDAIPNLLEDNMRCKQTFLEYAKDIAKIRYKKLRPGTIRNYKVIFDFLDEWKGLVSFADITEKNIMKMDKLLEDRGMKKQTRWNYHKIVKIFVIQAKEDGLIKINPYKRLNLERGNESGLTRVLTPEEFHRFERCEIDDKCLERVRDVFVFQTYTMMGYSDLINFKYKDCFTINGQICYKNNRIKTGREFTFAILEPAMEILKKYKFKLPIVSNVKYNLYLKVAVKYANIDKPVSTHYARHTGATMLLNDGKVDINTISKILGDTLRETERTYAKLLDESIVESMVSYHEKVSKVREEDEPNCKVITLQPFRNAK